MANTVVTHASTLNPVRVQEKLISVIAERENPFSSLIGTSSDSVIQRITDLEKNSGDSVRFHIAAKLSGQGVDQDALLEGNEEQMNFYSDSILIGQKRHAIRLDGAMTEQRSAIKLRAEAGPRLGTWGREWLTELLTVYASGARGVRSGMILPVGFAGFAGNAIEAPDAAHVLVNSTAGTKADLEDKAEDRMTTAFLDKAVRKLKLLINGGVPIRPITINGKKLWPCYITPEQAYDLRQDTKWREAQQYANTRGESNPLIEGSLGVWNNLILRELDTGVLFSDYGAGGNIAAARALIMGAQSMGIAYGNSGGTDAGEGRWRYIEKDSFDYSNQVGFAVKTIMGVKKLRFNSADYGILALDTNYSA